jgi:outer membrane autotransporter protein
VSGSSDNTTTSGSVTVNASGATGPITADGSDAVGILADSGTLRNTNGGRAPTLMTGPVLVTANNVSTPGEFGAAISAQGGSGGVKVIIPSGGSTMGGWQALPFTPPATPLLPGRPPASVTPSGNISSISGLPATGVFLSANGGGTATLINGGSIGALSDLAVATNLQISTNPLINPPIPASPTRIINKGTITGFVQLGSSNNIILNNGTFDLRDFVDTTGLTDSSGNGVRDTVRVVTADFGSGPNNIFTNNGTLALPQVTGATKLDDTGQYLPLKNTSNEMALNGPLQAQLLGVATFTNSGTIDLQSNPVPGDVLMITGGRGGSSPGTGGGGTYVSNGGTLMLDTVLNEGGAATVSDTLVVDGTSVGPKGPTKTDIVNARPGEGALTEGDGILVVQVLDPSRSANNAFTLANDVEDGPFDYMLFHGGVNGSNPADWFLRNTFVVQPPEPSEPTEPPGPEEPEPPLPPGTQPPETGLPEFPSLPPSTDQPLPPGVYPIIGPRLATDGVVQPIARQMGLTTLGTLHQRIGETLLQESPPWSPQGSDDGWALSAWGRVFGDQIDNSYQAFADPNVDGRIIGVQAGLDIWRGNLIKAKGHRDAAGLYFAYGHSAADVNGLVTNPAATGYVMTQTGSLDLNGYSGGAYWTHYGPSGWYLDGVVQGTAYTGTATTAVSSLPTSGSGILLSLEGGYPVPLRFGPNFILEPQAQIIWQHIGFSEANDGLTSVDLGSTSGTTGRLGLRGQWTIPQGNGPDRLVWQPYVRANLWRDWGGNVSTTFSGSPLTVPLLEQATRLEFAGGITARVNSSLSFYAQGGYQFAVGDTAGGERQGVSGDLGLRITW